MDIVLGAGIVGTCVALQLKRRGRDVVLVDRQAPGLATSYGNAGLLERSDLMPRTFPRDPFELAQYATGTDPRVTFDWAFLPRLAPFLYSYWRASAPPRLKTLPDKLAPLFLNSIDAHKVLMAEAGAEHLFRTDGWLHLYRDSAVPKDMLAAVERARDYGMVAEVLTGDDIAARMPQLKRRVASAVQWNESASVSDPGELTRLYAELFEALGGTLTTADVRSATPVGAGWTLETDGGPLNAENLVVALGPWSADFVAPLGYRIPFAVKRGYHMHFAIADADRPQLPVIDADNGIAISPMTKGMRMTTGIQFAPRDAAPNYSQVDRGETALRELFAVGGRVDNQPWMGARPCTPDMRPIIGPAPKHDGLWFAFGHAHHGLTLGAITGQVLAETIAGETPLAALDHFLPARFG